MKLMRYVVIGDVGLDTILTLDEQAHDRCRLVGDELRLAAGQKIPATASHQSIGGNAANVAVCLSRLSAEVRLISHVGNDWSARHIKVALEDEGLAGSSIVSTKDGSNHSTILLCEGERTIVSYHAAGPYRLDKLRPDDWLILCSMGEEGNKALDQALALDLPLVYLPGTRQIKGSLARNKRLIKRAELVVVNLEEAQEMLDARSHDSVILARRFLDLGAREAVVTNGRNGAVAAHSSGNWHGSMWHGVHRVDPTGAGDAFASTYLWSRLAGATVPDALKMASLNAGSVVAEYGSTSGLLKRTTIQRLMKTEQVTVRREGHERS